MYVNNIEPEMFLPPGSESFNHNATRTTSSRSRSNNVNNNIVPVYMVSRLLKRILLQVLEGQIARRTCAGFMICFASDSKETRTVLSRN